MYACRELKTHVLQLSTYGIIQTFFCSISNMKVYGPYFFARSTVTGLSYLDMLREWLMPQVEDDSDDFIHQQDGTVPHYHHLIHVYLNQQFPHHWTGHMTTEDQVLLPWPPRSLDLTKCDFFFYGDMLSTVSLYHRICLISKDKSLLPSQKLIVTCCSRYGWD